MYGSFTRFIVEQSRIAAEAKARAARDSKETAKRVAEIDRANQAIAEDNSEGNRLALRAALAEYQQGE